MVPFALFIGETRKMVVGDPPTLFVQKVLLADRLPPGLVGFGGHPVVHYHCVHFLLGVAW